MIALLFTEYKFCAKHCDKYFKSVIAFNPHKSTMIKLLFLSLAHLLENCGLKMLVK